MAYKYFNHRVTAGDSCAARDWVKNNVQDGRCGIVRLLGTTQCQFWFEHEQDAVAFKLTYGHASSKN